MSDVTLDETSRKKVRKAPSRRAPGPAQSVLDGLTCEEIQSLRLDDDSRVEFDTFAKRFKHGKAELSALEAKNANPDEDLFDRMSAAEAERRNSGMAVVYFLAPRILKLREGEAKRKWRSLLTKFRKDEGLN